jgi:hypothetical protein
MIDGLTLFPFEPDWSDPVKLTAAYVTDIKREATPGSMTRDSGRDYGRRELSFSAWFQGDVRRSWDAWRDANPPFSLVGVPLWSEDAAELTAGVAIAGTSLTISETANIDWRGELVLVNTGDGSTEPVCEAAAIQSVSGNTITLTSGLATAFSAGTKVLPLLRARHPADYAEDIIDEEFSTASFTFQEDLAYIGSVTFPTTPVYPTYSGLPVFPLIFDESESSQQTLTKAAHLAAAGITREAFATLRTYPRQTWQHRVGFEDRAARAMLWQFFNDRRGRWQRFWLASLKNELRLSANVSSGDTTLQLANYAEFVTRYQLGGELRKVIIIVNGSNYWLRQVSNLSGGTNRVTIDSSLGTSLTASATKVGLLELVQFATDDLEIDLTDPYVGDVAVHFSELESEYTEAIVAGTASGTIQDVELVTT